MTNIDGFENGNFEEKAKSDRLNTLLTSIYYKIAEEMQIKMIKEKENSQKRLIKNGEKHK